MSLLELLLLVIFILALSIPVRRLWRQWRADRQQSQADLFRWRPDTDPEGMREHRRVLRQDYSLFRPSKKDYQVEEEPPEKPKSGQ